MKVLILNGSPRKDGNTTIAVNEMIRVFGEEGIETDAEQIGNKDIRGCIACGSCAKTGKCAFGDIVNELAPKFEAADGLVVASPVYMYNVTPPLFSIITRLNMLFEVFL